MNSFDRHIRVHRGYIGGVVLKPILTKPKARKPQWPARLKKAEVKRFEDEFVNAWVPDERVYIIAGNYDQASLWAMQVGLLSKEQWCYISEPGQLRGLRGAQVEFIGTWRSRRDAEALYREAEWAKRNL